MSQFSKSLLRVAGVLGACATCGGDGSEDDKTFGSPSDTFNGLLDYVSESTLRLGKDCAIFAYSFNRAEGAAVAHERDEKMLIQTSQPASPTGWRFLTGSQEAITALDRQLDFRVRRADKEIEHSSAIFLFGPEGNPRRYLACVEFPVERVHSALRWSDHG